MIRLSIQRICGLVLFFISLAICVESLHVSLGSLSNPGPGFVSFCSGALIGILSAVLIYSPRRFEESESGQGSKFSMKSWKVLYTVLALSVYGLLLERIGFLILTFLLMIFFLIVIDPQKWWKALMISILASLGFQVVFIFLLKVDLPTGMFGF